MPIKNYTKKDNIFSSTMCSICLADFEDDEPIRKIGTCGHIFHPRCLLYWLVKEESCPMCKISLEKRDLLSSKKLSNQKKIFGKSIVQNLQKSFLSDRVLNKLPSIKEKAGDNDLEGYKNKHH